MIEKMPSRKISDIPCSNILTNMSSKSRDIKERINKCDLIKIKSFFMTKENSIKMKRGASSHQLLFPWSFWELMMLTATGPKPKDLILNDAGQSRLEEISENSEDGSEIGGSRLHFPSTPVKHLADLRNRANRQQYSAYMKIGDQR